MGLWSVSHALWETGPTLSRGKQRIGERKGTYGETNRKRSEGMEKEGKRRARSFVSRGAEAGIQALLSGTPFLRVSTLSSGRVSYVKDFLPRSPSSSSSSSSSSTSSSSPAAAAPRQFSVSFLACHLLFWSRTNTMLSQARTSDSPSRSRHFAHKPLFLPRTRALHRCTVRTPTRCYESQFAEVRLRRCFLLRIKCALNVVSFSLSVPRSDHREPSRMSSKLRRSFKTVAIILPLILILSRLFYRQKRHNFWKCAIFYCLYRIKNPSPEFKYTRKRTRENSIQYEILY